jgi:hypothetical protein
MIRTTNKNEKFILVHMDKFGITVAFDYIPFYDINEHGDQVETNIGTWTEHTFFCRPSFWQLKDFILTELNKGVSDKILSGFTWKDMPIWLSTENQLNYKSAYDLAVQTNGANLPVTFKFGSMDEPIYHEFTTIEELHDFYLGATAHINSCLQDGWKKKDNINWSEYEELLNKI